jgi:hypothetical protein
MINWSSFFRTPSFPQPIAESSAVPAFSFPLTEGYVTYPPEREIPIPDSERITWHLTVLALDNIDYEEKVAIPLKEVDRFLQATSRFKLKVTYVPFNDRHNYNIDPASGRACVHWSVLPEKWIKMIEPCSSVLALYKFYDLEPIHGGDTWALRDGIYIKGRLRGFSSIGVDKWYFNNQPYEGFNSRGGQIAAHEEVNIILETVSKTYPNACPLSITGINGLPAWKYESQRIEQIGPGCYKALGTNPDTPDVLSRVTTNWAELDRKD